MDTRTAIPIAHLLVAVLFLSICHPAFGDAASDARLFIEEARNIHGSPPTETQFWQFLNQQEQRYSLSGTRAAWREWRVAQRPSISPGELAAIEKSKRELIADIDISYTNIFRNLDPEFHNKADYTLDWRVARSGSMRLIDKPTFGTNSGLTNDARIIQSYDGQTVRMVTFPEDAPARAEIHNRFHSHHYYTLSEPLALSMMIDSLQATNLGQPFYSLDLLAMLRLPSAIVQERHETSNGTECVVVCSGVPATIKVYLDISRNYAPVRMEYYKLRLIGITATDRDMTVLRTLSDLEKVAEKLWLPRIVVQRYMRRFYNPSSEDNPLQAVRSVIINEIAVNKGIDESVFSAVFPVGMPVWDIEQNVRYIHGVEASIQEQLDDTIAEIRTQKGLADIVNSKINHAQIPWIAGGASVFLAVASFFVLRLWPIRGRLNTTHNEAD